MTDTIALGGRTFALRPLKLGQLRHLVDALEAMQGKTGGALIEAAAAVVAAGLVPAHPALDTAAVLDLEADVPALSAAVAAVLRIAGLVALGEGGPVAGNAAADPPGSSARSTPPSPPAAAIPTPSSTP